MSKIIKIVAVVAIAVAIVVFAAPIAGALAGLAPGLAATTISAATMAAITSAVVGVGISLGLSAISTLFRKSATVSNSMADRLNVTIVPSTPRKVVFGRTAAAADMRFRETYGSKQDRHAQVIALASHRVNAITQFYLEETLTWQGALVAHQNGITSFRAVTEGKPGNGFPLGSGSYWTASATFTGCAYIAIDYKLDAKAWPQGIPSKLTTIVEGCPLYDPRQDSTRGGSGSHRSNDQNTWAWHGPGAVEIGRNPALALLTYLLGWRINGKLAWGMGVGIESIDLDNFRTFANVCEERVQTAGGGTVQRYTADGIVSTADTHDTVINAITAAMGSTKLTDVSGQYTLVGGYDDTFGPKVAFDANDLVGAPGAPTPYDWTPSGPTRDTYNIVRGRFANPDELYQLVDWGEIVTDDLSDGVPRTLTLDLGFVNRAESCQRIAKQFVAREAKTPGFFTATWGPKAFLVQVGSLLTLSLPSQGWNNKLFRVQEQTETHDMIFQMTLREESPEVYAWDKDEAKPLPATIRPPGYDASMTISVQNLRLSSTTYQGT
ncbi:hypothetical protein [Sphingomonas sp. Leaf242]|uniref:hypothetical protein n=1 Tax=Sphingomonas sp. Leaf242 TaxID=1736304 RepID=UPI000712B5CC|nr:hypothetical protein [Sphingomonas sp. Leaf242]KQO06898.1 hypothetical protein ASF09_11600 [Sphingomonas sp. Leaf242]